MIARWTEILVRRAAWVLLVGLLATTGAAAYGLGVFGHLGQGGFDDPSSQSARALDRQQDVFGSTGADLVVIYRSRDLRADDTAQAPRFREEVEQALADVPQDAVDQVVTPWTAGGGSGRVDPAMVGDGGHAVQVLVSLTGKSQDAKSDSNDVVLPAVRSTGSDALRSQVAGTWAVYTGVNEQVSTDLARAETLSAPIVLLLSLIIFGSLVAALQPLLVGAVAVLGALAVVRLLTTVTDVSVFSINVITLLGTGLAIDYALFVISRFREELARLPLEDPEAVSTALRTTMATAGRTVLFSALTVTGAMSALLIFPQDFLRSLGYGGVAAVLVAALAALTVLPAVLRLLGRRVDAGRVRLPGRRRRVRVSEEEGAWARLAGAVMRHPVVVVTLVGAALLVVASPFLGVRWGSVDYRVLPPDSPAHVAAVALNEDFGGERSFADVVVATDDQAVLAPYAERLSRVSGVESVRTVDTADGTTLLQAGWAGNSQTDRSLDIVRDLRAVDPPTGTDVLVGGLSASTVDLLTSLRAHLPWMGLIIASVMLVLLFLAFGSVVLPLKAIVMNVVSISASFGAITWIFADGHLQHLLGFTSTGFLDATQPIFMLAILVGLSMDYEVFLLSRVREQWDHSHDNTRAVAVGLQKTGRIITSAALLLAVVIGAFGTSGVVFMKMIGIGMLVALLVDATVVRALLVPATMKLLGRWNWWAPAPMRRFWDRFGLREEEPVREVRRPAPAVV